MPTESETAARSGNGNNAAPPSEEDCQEMLLCARYGEEEDMIAFIEAGVPLSTKDGSGNTALHYTAANGLASCVQYLARAGAPYTTNNSGNYPLNWAIQNKAVGVVKLLLASYPEINVLKENSFGKSSLTDAFNCNDEEILKLILEHESAKPLDEPTGVKKKVSASGEETEVYTMGDVDDDGASDKKGTQDSTGTTGTEEKTSSSSVAVDTASSSGDDRSAMAALAKKGMARIGASESESGAEGSQIVQSITHEMTFGDGDGDGSNVHVSVREVATDWTGEVFGKDAVDDITGIQVWAASLVAARWVADLASEFDGKDVIELGCGCGLPGLAALAYTNARHVALTDFFKLAIDNLHHNISINDAIKDVKERASVHAVDWTNPETWIKANDGSSVRQFDIVLGCDLVYDIDLIGPLVAVIMSTLKKTGTFYYVSGGKRQGAKEFIAALREQAGMHCEIVALKESYKANPLVSGDDAALELHFNELHENQQLLFKFTLK